MRNNTVRVVFLKQLDFLFFESKTNNAFVFCKALWFLGESHIPVTCHTLISLQHHVRVWIFEELPTVYIYAQTGGPRCHLQQVSRLLSQSHIFGHARLWIFNFWSTHPQNDGEMWIFLLFLFWGTKVIERDVDFWDSLFQFYKAIVAPTSLVYFKYSHV